MTERDEEVAMVIDNTRPKVDRMIGHLTIMYDYACPQCDKVNSVIDKLDPDYHKNFSINKFIHSPEPRLVQDDGDPRVNGKSWFP